MSWLLVTIVALVGFTLWLIATAPEGYEDDDGFHYGQPQEHDKDFF